VRFTRAVVVLGFALYVFLWVLAFNGLSALREVLAVPLILVVLIAGGVALNRFMGVTPRRREHFKERDDESTR
jgi:uncharacterized membrane protein YidH (DUF202 family)